MCPLPIPPTPMIAWVRISLGGVWPLAASTCRGTRVKAAVAAAVFSEPVRKARLESSFIASGLLCLGCPVSQWISGSVVSPRSVLLTTDLLRHCPTAARGLAILDAHVLQGDGGAVALAP